MRENSHNRASLLCLVLGVLATGLAAGNEAGRPPPMNVKSRMNQEAGSMPRNPMTVSGLLARYDRLPDLFSQARAIGKDVHAGQEQLAREHDAWKQPYRLSMPHRNPGRPCSRGEHTPCAIKYTLVNPARNERAELWEADVHEAREHGAPFPAEAATLLGNLADAE